MKDIICTEKDTGKVFTASEMARDMTANGEKDLNMAAVSICILMERGTTGNGEKISNMAKERISLLMETHMTALGIKDYVMV